MAFRRRGIENADTAFGHGISAIHYADFSLAFCDEIEHVPLETQTSLTVPEPSGRLTIYSSTQAMYFSMGVVAAHLQVPLNRLKLVGGTVGGGFGGKVDTATETLTALLALKANRPVKWRFTREEEFLCSSTRAPWHIEIADALTNASAPAVNAINELATRPIASSGTDATSNPTMIEGFATPARFRRRMRRAKRGSSSCRPSSMSSIARGKRLSAMSRPRLRRGSLSAT